MGFSTVGDVYEVSFRVTKKVNGNWAPDVSGGEPAKHYVVATSEQNAVSVVQSYMGHNGSSVNVMCHGGVRKVLPNVIIAA